VHNLGHGVIHSVIESLHVDIHDMHRPFRKIFKVTEFQKGLTVKVFTEISSKSENQKATITSDGSLKGYDDGTSKMVEIQQSNTFIQSKRNLRV
jgi:hypothetical protein